MSHHITSTIDPLQRVQSRMRRPELLHKQERGKTSPVLRPITLASDQVLHCLQTLRCSLTWCELATVPAYLSDMMTSLQARSQLQNSKGTPGVDAPTRDATKSPFQVITARGSSWGSAVSCPSGVWGGTSPSRQRFCCMLD